MRKIFVGLFIVCVISISGTRDISQNVDVLPTDSVLICNGSMSSAYHNSYCDGLIKCQSSVEKTTIIKAEELDRRPCGFCYPKY